MAREEHFNTLENRVLLSYARVAREVAREYRDRHASATGSARVRRVQGFGLRCGRLERDLRERGVHAAAADVTPNFALQNNTDYRDVWVAWHELLQRERILDRLWRWQARSWEEFCALAVVVALQALPGTRLLAVSPLLFREEQLQGCWIRHSNPLAGPVPAGSGCNGGGRATVSGPARYARASAHRSGCGLAGSTAATFSRVGRFGRSGIRTAGWNRVSLRNWRACCPQAGRRTSAAAFPSAPSWQTVRPSRILGPTPLASRSARPGLRCATALPTWAATFMRICSRGWADAKTGRARPGWLARFRLP